MAYLRKLDVYCQSSPCKANGVASPCKAKAVVVLIDRWNGQYGQFCRKCGEKELKNLKEAEAKDA